jgi:hypothetical protein
LIVQLWFWLFISVVWEIFLNCLLSWKTFNKKQSTLIHMYLWVVVLCKIQSPKLQKGKDLLFKFSFLLLASSNLAYLLEVLNNHTVILMIRKFRGHLNRSFPQRWF